MANWYRVEHPGLARREGVGLGLGTPPLTARVNCPGLIHSPSGPAETKLRSRWAARMTALMRSCSARTLAMSSSRSSARRTALSEGGAMSRRAAGGGEMRETGLRWTSSMRRACLRVPERTTWTNWMVADERPCLRRWALREWTWEGPSLAMRARRGRWRGRCES